MTDPRSEEQLVQSALAGERRALESLVGGLQDRVYGLALRMLGDLEDAHDATQEILLRVVTRLSTFRGQSRLSTWVYRLATNVLLDWKRAESRRVTFEQLDADLGQPEPGEVSDATDAHLLAREVYQGCALGIFQCLNPDQRIAVILGDVLGLDHREASESLGISSNSYRQRLSRAHRRLGEFLVPRCSLINAEASCRCAFQVPLNVEKGRLQPGNLRLVTHPCDTSPGLLLDPAVRARANRAVDAVGDVIDAVELLRRQPQYHAPTSLRQVIQSVLDARLS